MVSSESFDNVDNIVPVTGGFNITFGNVLKQINKIIQTIINKLKENNNNIESHVRGIHEKKSLGTTLTFPESGEQTESKEILITSVNTYFPRAHLRLWSLVNKNGDGVSLDRMNEGIVREIDISPSHPEATYWQPSYSFESTREEYIYSGGSGGYYGFDCILKHNDDNSTSLYIRIKHKGAEAQYNNIVVEYELY